MDGKGEIAKMNTEQVTTRHCLEEVVRDQALAIMDLSSHLTFAEALEIMWERVGFHRNEATDPVRNRR